MNFEEAIAYLSSLGKFGWHLGLERIQALCEAFQHPEHRFPSIHIAGTNGKGSTSTMVASILQASGYRTGLYLSPYVRTVCERIQVDGHLIPEEDLAHLITRIAPVVPQVAQKPHCGQPTEFEVKTLAGFLYFAEQKVDYAVIEVGLGGRYDATNVIFPKVTVITNISLDHTERLGHTLTAIAGEKAGIIKEGVPCVTGAKGEALEVIAQTCQEKKAPLYRLGKEIRLIPQEKIERGNPAPLQLAEGAIRYPSLISRPEAPFTVEVMGVLYSNLRLSLLGEFQKQNAALAVSAVHLLREQGADKVTEQTVQEGLERAYLPGRLEVIRENPGLVLDGAHNGAKAEALAQALQTLFQYRHLILVLGMTKGHQVNDIVKPLVPLAHRVVVTEPAFRAFPAEDLYQVVKSQTPVPVSIAKPVPLAVEEAFSYAEAEDLVCVTGSLYVVGEVPIEQYQEARV